MPSYLPWWLALTIAACNGEDGNKSGEPPGGDYREGDALVRPRTCQLTPWVARVEGTVEDQAGDPIPGAKAQLCVRVAETRELQCIYPAETDATGVFVVSVPLAAQCMESATMRVLRPGSNKSTAYCALALPQTQSFLTLAEPFVLHDTTPATTLPPEGDGHSERTVIFADGLEVDVTPEHYFGSGDGYAALASRQLAPDTAGLCFVANPSTLHGVWAFSPEGDINDATFPLRIPNQTGLSAGSETTLYVLGGLGCTLADSTLLEEGVWHPFGTATVSGDEQTISGDPLPCLGWLGYGPL